MFRKAKQNFRKLGQNLENLKHKKSSEKSITVNSSRVCQRVQNPTTLQPLLMLIQIERDAYLEIISRQRRRKFRNCSDGLLWQVFRHWQLDRSTDVLLLETKLQWKILEQFPVTQTLEGKLSKSDHIYDIFYNDFGFQECLKNTTLQANKIHKLKMSFPFEITRKQLVLRLLICIEFAKKNQQTGQDLLEDHIFEIEFLT